MAYRYVFQPLVYLNRCWYDGNPREFIMAMLLRHRHPVERKSREAKNAKDFIRYISGLMSND